MAKIVITETLQKIIDVYWLSDVDEALGYVQSEYDKQVIVLTADDFELVEFEEFCEVA